MRQNGNIKKIIAIAAFLLFFFGPSVLYSPPGKAESTNELQKLIDRKSEEIKKLEQQSKEYRQEISNQAQTGQTLKGELAKLDLAIKKLRSDIYLNQQKISKTELEIDQTAASIQDKETSINKLHRGLAGMVQAIYENDRENMLKVLMKNPTVTAFFNQLDYAEYLQKKMLSSLEELKNLEKELQDKKIVAEGKKSDLAGLQQSLHDQKQIQEGTKDDKNDLLAVTKNQEKKYQALLAETKQKQEEILKEIDEIEEKLRQMVNPDSLPKTGTGFFTHPVDGYITQGYGETSFTKSSGKDYYNFHNGLDFTASIGTPIKAPADGIVLAVGNSDNYCPKGAYGKYIVIDHQNNLATLYGHLSLIKVNSGQTIQRGDIIGYTGNSGLTTGPHLHFTVYDARTVEIRKGITGACGLLPFGGSVNPLDYL